MDKDYNIFIKKIEKMMGYIKKEHDIIMKNYNERNIMKKSYPIRVTKLASKEQKQYVNKCLKSFFEPSLKVMSPLIEKGFIMWAETDKQTDLKDILKNKEQAKNLIYESWEKLFIYKNIKYNLTFSFIIQAYLFTEREITSFLQQKYNDLNTKTLFSAIKIVENKLERKISSSIKTDLDMYRNIINVYKHGEGDSFEMLKKNHSNILNNDKLTYNDSTFIFNLELINFDNFYCLIKKLLDEMLSKGVS